MTWTGAQVLTLNLVLSSLCHPSGDLTSTQCSQIAALGEKGQVTEEVKGAFLHPRVCKQEVELIKCVWEICFQMLMNH